MNYLSTRGVAKPAPFTSILLEGLSNDGGLYVPEAWPQLSTDDLLTLSTLPYAELAAHIITKFAPEIPFEELLTLTKAAYTPSAFCHTREGSQAAKIFPVRRLEDDLYLLELSNGPTLAFKDAAMQLLGHLLSWALEKQGQTLTILGATSGDTGSAAIHALRGKKGIKVAMLSPLGRMSAFQRAQMYSVLDDNVRNIAVRGTFDDCQDLVKALNADAAFKARHHLGAVNSINWARVVAQTVYYVTAYFQTVRHIGDPVSFCVPSGNFGNAYAGLVAKMMGLPIGRIIVATNENDVLHRALTSGLYKPSDVALQTSSPSMDITKASNFERAVFEATGRNGDVVARMWRSLATEGSIDFARDYPDAFAHLRQMGIASASSTHANRLDMIRMAKKTWDILIDPHTADGVKAALELRKAGETMIILETAQAAKFAATLQEALGTAPPVPKGFEGLLSAPQKYEPIDANATALGHVIDEWNK